MKANPKSIARIRSIALEIREILGIKPMENINIIRLLEMVICPVFNLKLEIIEKCMMTDKYAEYNPIEKVIRIREDVYDNAVNGIGRDRFTISHEIGHIFLHSDNIVMARSNEKFPIYCDPEWQANTFAREFLCPINGILICDDIETIANRYGVSKEVARIQLSQKK